MVVVRVRGTLLSLALTPLPNRAGGVLALVLRGRLLIRGVRGDGKGGGRDTLIRKIVIGQSFNHGQKIYKKNTESMKWEMGNV